MIKKYFLLTLLLFLILNSCNRQTEEKDNYVFDDYYLTNCNIYKMIFDSGYYYIFKIAMSGPCDSIFEEEFIAEYTRFYSSNDTISKRKGKIIIEYYNDKYSSNWNKKKMADTLALITQKYSGYTVVYLPNDKESYEDKIILEVR
jgi:hypothetical protein